MAVNGAFMIKYRGAEPGLPKRQFNNMKKASFAAIAKYWHVHYRPQHFRESAYSRYRYQARSRAYVKRKKRVKGHNKPLVWSGETERAAKMARITSTNKYGRVAMSVPKLNYRNPKSRIRMGDELRKVNKNEIQQLQRQFDIEMQREIDAVKEVRTVTLKAA